MSNDAPSQAEKIIAKFGGASALARALGHRFPSTVQVWKEGGFIPPRHHQAIVDAARECQVELYAEDFATVDLPTRASVAADEAAA